MHEKQRIDGLDERVKQKNIGLYDLHWSWLNKEIKRKRKSASEIIRDLIYEKIAVEQPVNSAAPTGSTSP